LSSINDSLAHFVRKDKMNTQAYSIVLLIPAFFVLHISTLSSVFPIKMTIKIWKYCNNLQLI
jgi:hypothetical protein